MVITHIIGYLLLIGILLFYNIPAFFWLLTFLVINSFFFTLGFYSVSTLVSLSSIFIAAYLFLGVKFFRRKIITSKVLDFFKRKLPRISDTEAQAIEAGDVWWEGDIFSANIDWSKIEQYKLTDLTEDERKFIDNEVEHFCDLLNDWDIVTKNKDLSIEAWEYLKKNKFFSINIEKKYGGLEFSATAQSLIVAKVASRSITAAVTIMVPNALGPGELLTHYGTEEQKQKYLKRLAECQEIPCFALTSTYAGSDAGGMLDNGVICKQNFQGVDTLGIRLNFSKRYITLAPVATLMGLAFKLYDPDSLLGNKRDLGVTLALIPTNQPGITIGRRHLAMYTPFQNGPIRGENVFIPMDYIIGGPDYIGKGWFMLMECLSGGRGISLPALSTATTQIAYLSSVAYSNLRKQFKTSIADLEGIQEKVAKVSGLNFITTSVNLLTTSAIDKKLKPAVISAISKYHMTEMSRDCINIAMDIHAGKGVMNGPNNYLVNAYIGSPVAITVEGANILTRNLIIFGQGAFRAHPYVLQELEALNNPDANKSLSQFDTVLFKHIKFVFRNVAKLSWYNIDRFLSKVSTRKNWLEKYKNDISKFSTALAFATDIALLDIGGQLKVKEKMSARLGDVVSNIYMGMCVIKYYTKLASDNKENKEYLKKLELHTQWSLDYILYSAKKSLYAYIRNFPVMYSRTLMKVFIMPWARKYKYPNDTLEIALAKSNKLPDTFTSDMVRTCYLSHSPLGFLNNVYHDCTIMSSLLDRIDDCIKSKQIQSSNCIFETFKQALDKNFIDQHEYEKLLEFANNVDKIINVDDFESVKFETFIDCKTKELSDQMELSN